jgi:phosphoglycerate dehydrogenase-like enzyme
MSASAAAEATASVAAPTIGVLYPSRYHPTPESFDAAVDELRAAEPAATVLVAEFVDPSELRTRRSSPTFRRGPHDVHHLDDHVAEVLSQVDVVLALDLPFDVATWAPSLRWVQAVGAGVGQLRSAGLAQAGIRLTTASGTSSPEIAEFVMARILEHLSGLPRAAALQADRTWRPVYGRAVAGTTVGLVGFGSINRQVARLATAFGMHVIATRRHPERSDGDTAAGGALVDGVRVVGAEALAEMVGECDVVVAALPETPDTLDVFDAELFARMRPGALFCNVGRGTAVVDEDLVDALVSGHLGAAALDVFRDEPLAPEHPYWTTPGLRMTAHSASVPSASIVRVHELFRQNLGRYVAGEPLINEVDPAIGS